jgi:hypothetical protein
MTTKNIIARECIIALVVLFGGVVPAVCQTAGSPPQNCVPGKSSSADQNLSGKLSRSNGVLCPPNVDPGMTAPTPNKGTMPVIPPPGSSPSQPVQPK